MEKLHYIAAVLILVNDVQNIGRFNGCYWYLLIERISSPVLPYFRGLQYASLNYKILILTDVFQGNIFIYLYIYILLFIVHVAAIYVGQIYFRGRTLIVINFRITSSLLNEMFQQNTSNWLYFMNKKTYVGLFISCNFTVSLKRALVYINIVQGIQ